MHENPVGSRQSRTRSAAFVGLSIALISVSAWIVVPVGPVPFTLQMLSITMVICLLPARQATAVIFLYVLLGALGAPVFSGMRGGLGVLLGPTGGFLIGYLVGVPIAALILNLVKRHTSKKTLIFAAEIASGVIFTAIAYSFGCVQYSLITGVGLLPSFIVSCAPFIVPDLIKIAAAVICAQPVKSAIAAMRGAAEPC